MESELSSIEPGTNKAAPWTSDELNKLYELLLEYGWGRWNVFRTEGGLNHPVEHIEAYAASIIRALLSLSKCEFQALKRCAERVLESEKAQQYIAKEPSPSNQFKAKISENPTEDLSRIDLLFLLDCVVTSCKGPPNDFVIPPDPDMPNWSQDDDRRLIFDVWRNGYSFKQKASRKTPEVYRRLTQIYEALKPKSSVCISSTVPSLTFSPVKVPSDFPQIGRAEHTKIVDTLTKFGLPDNDSFITAVALPNIDPAQIAAYAAKVVDFCEQTAEKNIPDGDFLRLRLHSEEQRLIIERTRFFKKLRNYLKTGDISVSNRAFLQTIADNGLGQLKKEKVIKSRVAPEFSAADVISSVMGILPKDKVAKKAQAKLVEKETAKPAKTKEVDEETPRPISDKEDDSDSWDGTFPASLNASLTIVSIGKLVADRAGFHCERYIYPSGYISEKQFPSVYNPDERIWYRSSVIDRGGDGPIFRVEMKNNPSHFFEGTSPTQPWSMMVKEYYICKYHKDPVRGQNASVSGPEYFGFTQPTVKRLMDEMVGSHKLKGCPYLGSKSRSRGKKNVTEKEVSVVPIVEKMEKVAKKEKIEPPTKKPRSESRRKKPKEEPDEQIERITPPPLEGEPVELIIDFGGAEKPTEKPDLSFADSEIGQLCLASLQEVEEYLKVRGI